MTQQHAMPQPQYQPPVAPSPSLPKGLAIAALIVGIVGFLMGLLPIVGAIVGIAAIILGAIALSKKQPKGLALTGLILGIVAALASIGMTAGIGAIGGQVAQEVRETTVTEAPAIVEPEEAKEVEQTEPPTTVTPAPQADPEPELTIGQRNAIRSAEQYLRFTSFSREGLIGQLEFESFSREDATFAVDSITVDWNEQAAKSAESYLSLTSFSRQGLIDQLIFEGFTPEQAEFGVTAVGY